MLYTNEKDVMMPFIEQPMMEKYMAMKDWPGVKVCLECARCKKLFERPACSVRPNQLGFYCSRSCLELPKEQKAANIRAAKSLWVEKNRVRHLEGRRIWRNKNLDRIKVYRKKDLEKHGQRINEERRAIRRENPELVRNRDRENYVKNRDRILAYARNYAKNNPDIIRERADRFRRQNRSSAMWSHTKKSAKDKEIIFDLTHEWIKQRLDAGVCEMSGIPFDFVGKRTRNSPSMDRIKFDGPYTKDNCRIILWSINIALRNYGDEYVLDVFKNILERKAKK